MSILARRTGDGEDRVVHGGELPEGNSLDDIVVSDDSEAEEALVYSHPVYQPHLNQPPQKKYRHQLPNGELDREALAETFGLTFKTETPGGRKVSIRLGVDRKLAKIFGAKYFMFCDWNLKKPEYTLDEIQARLDKSGVDFPAKDLVNGYLYISDGFSFIHSVSYYFENVLDANKNLKYRLSFSREEAFTI